LMEANTIYEPQLAKNLRFYLFVHKEWCAKNQLDDPFADALYIRDLTNKDSLLEQTIDENECVFSAATKKDKNAEDFTNRQQQQQQHSIEEQVIWTLMEFLAISRAEAIALFNQYTGPSKDPAYILNTLLSEM